MNVFLFNDIQLYMINYERTKLYANMFIIEEKKLFFFSLSLLLVLVLVC